VITSTLPLTVQEIESAMLKQLHAHKTENRLERGLIEGEENVRPILLSHFWSVTFTIILLLAI
jgi:hypothetical protein